MPLAAKEGELGAGVAAEAGALEGGGWGRVYTKQVLIIIDQGGCVSFTPRWSMPQNPNNHLCVLNTK